jgi:hypothetical protein
MVMTSYRPPIIVITWRTTPFGRFPSDCKLRTRHAVAPKGWGSLLGGIGSGPCPTARFGIGCVELEDSTAVELGMSENLRSVQQHKKYS